MLGGLCSCLGEQTSDLEQGESKMSRFQRAVSLDSDLSDGKENEEGKLSSEYWKSGKNTDRFVFFGVLFSAIFFGVPLAFVVIVVVLGISPILLVVTAVIVIYMVVKKRNTSGLDEYKSLAKNPSVSATPQTANHLCVILHGLYGQQSDMAFMEQSIESSFKGKVLVFNVKCNEKKTTDGVDTGGDRVLKQIVELSFPRAELLEEGFSISFAGHSLGGIYARYIIGKLYEIDYFNYHKPINYMSFATPHLGVRDGQIAVQTYCYFLVGRTGRQLMLRDNTGKDGNPLLLSMSDPSLPYFRGLKLFENRAIYSNVMGDTSVGYCTGALRRRNPYWSEKKGVKDTGIVDSTNAPYQIPLERSAHYHNRLFPIYTPLADVMLDRLNRLKWWRIDVRLPFTIIPFSPSHEAIVAHRCSGRHARGRTVILDAVRKFHSESLQPVVSSAVDYQSKL